MIKSAPLSKRFIAYFVDFFIILILMKFVGHYENRVLDEFVSNGMMIQDMDIAQLQALQEAIFGYFYYYFCVYVPIYLSYHTFFVWYFGASLGKIFAKIRVANSKDEKFGKVSLMQSFVRAFFRLFSDIFFYVGFISIFTNEVRLGLHDKLSRSVVVSD